jgi:hypothetical protein
MKAREPMGPRKPSHSPPRLRRLWNETCAAISRLTPACLSVLSVLPVLLCIVSCSKTCEAVLVAASTCVRVGCLLACT